MLWSAAGLLALFLLFSGWWIHAPLAFASGAGGEVLVLLLAIAALALAAYLVRREGARG